MIKNIILDIGGIIADDSAKKYKDLKYKDKLNLPFEEIRNVGKIAFGSSFNECLLGYKTLVEHISDVVDNNPKYGKELLYMLDPKLYVETYPIIYETLEYVRLLKNRGYNIYFLSNITFESHEYIKNVLNEFDGGIYSYLEHVIKPDKEIYRLIIDKYNLEISECIFFDDNIKNVISANEFGLKSYVFTNIRNIENVLNFN